MRRKFDVRGIGVEKGRAWLILEREMQGTCFVVESSGWVRGWPHMEVVWVVMVTVRESRVQDGWTLMFSGVRFRLRRRGMCWPGAIFSG
jgi:hypothetical protein